MFCSSCGKEVKDEGVFCAYCGAPASGISGEQEKSGMLGSFTKKMTGAIDKLKEAGEELQDGKIEEKLKGLKEKIADRAGINVSKESEEQKESRKEKDVIKESPPSDPIPHERSEPKKKESFLTQTNKFMKKPLSEYQLGVKTEVDIVPFNEELDKKIREACKKGQDDEFYTRKEIKYLPEQLQKDEEPIIITSGVGGDSTLGNTWIIVLTNLRILLMDAGMIYGLETSSISLEKINSISGTRGLMFGKINFTDGSKEWEIDLVAKKSIKPFVDACMQEIDLFKQKSNQINTPPAQSAVSNDPYSKLEKLAELKEKGIISKEEFESEKSKILS